MISDSFTDAELISELRMFFDSDELAVMDFNEVLGQITEVDEDTRQVKIKNRTFQFDMKFCCVEEVEQ